MYAVMMERLPPFIPLIQALVRAGEETLGAYLAELARLAQVFCSVMLPLTLAVLETPDLANGLRLPTRCAWEPLFSSLMSSLRPLLLSGTR